MSKIMPIPYCHYIIKHYCNQNVAINTPSNWVYLWNFSSASYTPPPSIYFVHLPTDLLFGQLQRFYGVLLHIMSLVVISQILSKLLRGQPKLLSYVIYRTNKTQVKGSDLAGHTQYSIQWQEHDSIINIISSFNLLTWSCFLLPQASVQCKCMQEIFVHVHIPNFINFYK